MKEQNKKKCHTISETAVKLMLASHQKPGTQRTVEHKPKHDEKKNNKNTNPVLYFHYKYFWRLKKWNGEKKKKREREIPRQAKVKRIHHY